MVVFSVALTGLLPLLAILSRLATAAEPGHAGRLRLLHAGPRRQHHRQQRHLPATQLVPCAQHGAVGGASSARARQWSPRLLPGSRRYPSSRPSCSNTAIRRVCRRPTDGAGTFAAVGAWAYQPGSPDITGYYYDQAPLAPQDDRHGDLDPQRHHGRMVLDPSLVAGQFLHRVPRLLPGDRAIRGNEQRDAGDKLGPGAEPVRR